MADDMPQPRTVFSAWQEMRETWHRQKSDPEYAFDTQVPEPRAVASHEVDPNAESVGDLVEREFASR